MELRAALDGVGLLKERTWRVCTVGKKTGCPSTKLHQHVTLQCASNPPPAVLHLAVPQDMQRAGHWNTAVLCTPALHTAQLYTPAWDVHHPAVKHCRFAPHCAPLHQMVQPLVALHGDILYPCIGPPCHTMYITIMHPCLEPSGPFLLPHHCIPLYYMLHYTEYQGR